MSSKPGIRNCPLLMPVGSLTYNLDDVSAILVKGEVNG
jgi:hypothetical protein